MTTITASEADRSLKQRHRGMWASGDYPRVATELIAGLGPVIVRAAGIRAGQRVLDVAAGAGNATLPAARTGADVVACDLTPELLAAGERRAEQEGLRVEWVPADAEALPFPDGDFDAVLSVVGAMFAPHHQLTADELVRVVRRGGTVAMINWTPAGLVGQLFRTMGPYAPPPPPGAQPPALWGDPEHVRELFGDRVEDLTFERRTIPYPAWLTSPEQLRDYYKAYYGPTIAVYRAVSGDPERTAALDHDFADLLARNAATSGGTTPTWEAEYVVVTGRRRA